MDSDDGFIAGSDILMDGGVGDVRSWLFDECQRLGRSRPVESYKGSGPGNHGSSSAEPLPSESCGVGGCFSGSVSSSPNKPEKRSRSTVSDLRHAAGTSRAPAARSS